MRKIYTSVIEAELQPYNLPCQSVNELSITILVYLNKKILYDVD